MDTQTQLSIFNGGSWTVQNSTITNRTLTNSSLRHSTLSSSVPTNCDIQGCTITSSTLINCRLYGISKVNKCLISALALLPSSSTLNKLPVEIRDMIFEVYLEGEWNGKLPALLAALKGSEDLYLQALKAFRKLNAGVLYDDHRGELQNIAENPLSGIKTLVVEYVVLLPSN
jgi:hypothetical protein